MSLNNYRKDGVIIFELTDKLDGNNAREIQDEILNQMRDGFLFVLDMNKCGYISSAGLQVLLNIFKRIKKVDGTGAIARVMDPIKDIISMSGFDKIIDMYPDLDSAINAVKNGNI